MTARDFSGLVSRHRQESGLSATRLAELVGRNVGSVRAWERGRSIPRDPDVVASVAAVLGIDERTLFEAAGLEPPVVEDTPTIQDSLATLASGVGDDPSSGTPPPDGQELPAGTADLPAARHEDPELPDSGRRAGTAPADVSPHDEELSLDGIAPATDSDPATESDRQGFDLLGSLRKGLDRWRSWRRQRAVVEAAPDSVEQPPALYAQPPEPGPLSYLEDPIERLSYRARAIYTAVAGVVLVVVLIWAGSRTIETFGDIWDQTFGP